MAAFELEFALNVNNGQLSAGYLAYQPFTLPKLTQGDVVSLRLRLVKPNLQGLPGSFAQVLPDGIAVRVAIGTAGAPLTNADLISDGESFAGDLLLNVAAITGLAMPATKTFEIRLTGATPKKHLQYPVELQASILGAATVPDPAPDTYPTVAEMKAYAVPRDGGDQGQGFIMKDEDTGQAYRIFVKAGQLRCEAAA